LGPGSGDEIIDALHGLMHLFRLRRQEALRDAAQDVAPMEARVLGFFARHPGATAGELAEHSGRDKGQLARLIGGLRERGLLEATPDDADRRVVRLNLSAEGRALQQALARSTRRLADAAVAGLSAEERAALLGMMARLRANLE